MVVGVRGGGGGLHFIGVLCLLFEQGRSYIAYISQPQPIIQQAYNVVMLSY